VPNSEPLSSPDATAASIGLLSPDDPVDETAETVETVARRIANGRPTKSSRRGWARGYQPPDEVKPVLKAMSRTNVVRSTLSAVGDLSALLALSLAGAWAHMVLPAVAAWAVTVAVVLVIGRFGRAQECLVHEASHRNWQRNGKLNDVLANLLAGFPTASQVGGYRAQHVIHHAHLGSAEDPDIQRYEEFKLEELTGLRRWDLAKAVARRLPRYNWGWYTTIGTNPVTVALSGAWFVVVFGIVALLTSRGTALVAWAHWLAGYALVLPTIRMIGEAGEHRDAKGNTVFNATISNLGWWHRWVIHPHGDGHHTLHHLWSSVPHHQIRKMHEALAELDRDTFAGQIYWRAKVLENVRQGLPSDRA
jgi:fatty acid desaturase